MVLSVHISIIHIWSNPHIFDILLPHYDHHKKNKVYNGCRKLKHRFRNNDTDILYGKSYENVQ